MVSPLSSLALRVGVGLGYSLLTPVCIGWMVPVIEKPATPFARLRDVSPVVGTSHQQPALRRFFLGAGLVLGFTTDAGWGRVAVITGLAGSIPGVIREPRSDSAQ